MDKLPSGVFFVFRPSAQGFELINSSSCLYCSGALDKSSGVHLRLYLLQAPDFVNPTPASDETALSQLGDKDFLAKTDPAMLELYQVRFHITPTPA